MQTKNDYTRIKVWTRESHDQQVYKFYTSDGKLCGLNFHHGCDVLDYQYHKPDKSLWNTFLQVRKQNAENNKIRSEKKMIGKAIIIWLSYVQEFYE